MNYECWSGHWGLATNSTSGRRTDGDFALSSGKGEKHPDHLVNPVYVADLSQIESIPFIIKITIRARIKIIMPNTVWIAPVVRSKLM